MKKYFGQNLFFTREALVAFFSAYVLIAQPAIDEWTKTGTISPEQRRGLVAGLVLTVVSLWARAKNDPTVYTPKVLPGPNKEDMIEDEQR